MQDVLIFAILGPIVFLLATGSALVLAKGLVSGRRRPDLLMPAALIAMLLLFALTSVVLLSAGTDEGAERKHWSLVWAGRACSVTLMVIAFQKILLRFTGTRASSKGVSFVFPVFVIYWLSNIASPMLFGTRPAPSHEHLYSLVLGCAALLSAERDSDSMIRMFRNIVLLFLILGLLLLPLRPEWVISRVEPTFLPGLPGRYAGLAVHPNYLAPLAVAFMLCLWHSPFHRAWLNLLGWAVAALSLLLAESKTTISASVVIFGVVWWLRHGAELLRGARERRRSHLLAAIILLILVLIACIAVLAMFTDTADRLAAWTRSRGASETMTVTGRDAIWAETLKDWRQSPLFGYGLSMWDAAYRSRVIDAFHSHNQFLQSLGMSGLVGLSGLVLYLVAIAVAALKTARPSKGLTLGLFMLMAARSLTEIPFTLSGYSIELLIHLLLLTLIASFLAQQEPGDARRAVRLTPRTGMVT